MADKISAIVDYPEPSTFRQLRRFNGLVNFYRRFIPRCAELVQPLTDLLRGKRRTLEFTDSARQAFAKLKMAIADIALIAHHQPNAPLSLTTDASDVAVGAVLQQKQGAIWTPLAFYSQRLHPAETRYSAFGRELLAVYRAVRHFRHMLEGRPFKIFTDHKPLIYAFHSSSDRYSPRESRHLDYIAQYSTDLCHISGESNSVADALSRVYTLTVPDSIDLSALAAAQSEDPEIDQLRRLSSLNIQPVALPTGQGSILCDVSQGAPRPVVPAPFRRSVFDALHNLSHPGTRATSRLICKRFVWPKVNKEVRIWAQSCQQCQKAKIHLHTKGPAGTFPLPSTRFYHVHADLVGPLPPSRGAIYLLTCIDRFTRWVDAIPLPDCSSETVAAAFLDRWVSQFGCPTVVTTDRGSHFDGQFSSLMGVLGCQHVRTTAYHPSSNGMIERFHRQLKASLRARGSSEWREALPIVLLSIRNTYKPDVHATPAELVFGCTLRLPGELVAPKPPAPIDYAQYVQRLASHMRQLPSTPTRVYDTGVQVHKLLNTCTHVFIRNDGVRRPLTTPYSGPFRVLSRTARHFTVDRNGRKEVVSIDRLKVAFTEEATLPVTAPAVEPPPGPTEAPQPTAVTSSADLALTAPVPSTSVSRRGRTVRPPVRFNDFVDVRYI